MRAAAAALLLLPATLACYHVAQLQRLVGPPADSAAPALYAERCSTCHGEAGRGDGLGGVGLTPRPRDFSDAGWQRTTSDDAIRFVIRHGGEAAGLSSGMAPNSDLSDAEIDTLLVYIRGVGRRDG
jgi:mono/diheme cytochrome c family protein